MSDSKQPVLRLEDFPIKLAVWEDRRDTFTAYSAKIQKSFKDRDGNWKNTDYLSDGDWTKAAALLTEAWRRLRCQDSRPAPRAEQPAAEGPTGENIPF